MTSNSARIEALASHALDGYLRMREKIALLEPMLFDASVVASRGNGVAARGFNTLKHTLFLGCIQDIVNLCVDSDRRAPSLLNVVRTLEDPAIRGELRERYAEAIPPFVEPETDPFILEAIRLSEEKERGERMLEFDRLYDELQTLWISLSTSSLLLAFRQVRDKVTSHTELRLDDDRYVPVNLSTLGIKWGDIGAMAIQVERLVELCGLLVRCTGFAWDALKEQLRRVSEGFWQGAQGAR